jgi:geranylgeranyl reductase family protein
LGPKYLAKEKSKKFSKVHDVVIVGAGPAGSTLGFLLAKDGLNVLVIEKSNFPRQKLCGGLITQKTRLLIKDIYEAEFESLFPVENKASLFFVYKDDKKIISQCSPTPFYFINRKSYDMSLVSLAKKAGCPFIFNEKVVSVEDHAVYTQSHSEYKAKIIVGADGINSVIRRKIGQEKEFKKNLALAFQLPITPEDINKSYQEEGPVLFFGKVKYGYGWIFPHKDIYFVGMGGLIRKNKNIKESYTEFLDRIIKTSKKRKVKFEARLFPFGNFLKQPGYQNTLLLGDSAGFADPLTGEGIYYAHKSAERAALCIREFLKNNQEDLLPCYKLNLASIYRELRAARIFRDFGYRYLREIPNPLLKNKYYSMKLVKVIHGINKYSRIPLISKWI